MRAPEPHSCPTCGAECVCPPGDFTLNACTHCPYRDVDPDVEDERAFDERHDDPTSED